MTPGSSQSPVASGVRSLLIGAGALCVIVALSVAGASLYRFRPFPAGKHVATHAAQSKAGLGLRAEVRQGSLQVSWDHETAPVRHATSGSLTFQDGEARKTLQLTQTTARAGSVFYAARGTQVEVALTILAPDGLVSESISATVPPAGTESALSPASEAVSEILIPSEGEVALAWPDAGHPSRASQSSPSTRRPVLEETVRAPQQVSPSHSAKPKHSTAPEKGREGPAADHTPTAEVEAPDSTPGVLPGTVAIRVQVDKTGRVVNAVLVPQKDVDPAFAEAALEMARDWRFEASPAAGQHTRILEFRKPENR